MSMHRTHAATLCTCDIHKIENECKEEDSTEMHYKVRRRCTAKSVSPGVFEIRKRDSS